MIVLIKSTAVLPSQLSICCLQFEYFKRRESVLQQIYSGILSFCVSILFALKFYVVAIHCKKKGKARKKIPLSFLISREACGIYKAITMKCI